MRKRILVVPILVAVASVLVVLSLPVSSQPGQRVTLTVFDPRKTNYEKDINVGSNEFGPGDTSLFVEKFKDPETCEGLGEAVGRFQLVKFIGEEDGLFILDFTAKLDDGSITAYGSGKFSEFESGFAAAVTGGTGTYKDVRGEIRFPAERVEMCDTKGDLITLDLLLD